MNHEQTRIPFGGLANFQMASVSHLTLASNGEPLEGSVAIPPTAGFQRFCSATMAGPAEGRDDFLFLTGEEASEAIEVPDGAPFGPDPAYASANTRQSGLVAVLDPATGEYDDASAFFGPGTWLLDVQAHDVGVGPVDTTTTPGVTYKREGRQLILLSVDGS